MAEYIERWYYDITPVWRLPWPDELEHPYCVARGIGPFTRLAKRLLPPSRPKYCCWYHRGSWAEASEIAIDIVEAAQAEGLVGDTLTDAVAESVRNLDLLTWTREAALSLVDGGEPINIGSVDDWRGGDRFYVGGRHRAMAMIQQGVRRTVTMRLELLDPATGRLILD